MKHVIDTPTPVLAITSKADSSSASTVVEASVAALRETARRMGVEPVGPPLRVDHDDPSIVEICLMLPDLPEETPPAPIAAEVLTPGTGVESLA